MLRTLAFLACLLGALPAHAVLGTAKAQYASDTAGTVVGMWANEVVKQGGTVSAGRLALNKGLVQSFKNSGTWQLRDEFQSLLAENATAALVLWKSRVLSIAVASPTFTTDRGYACNGTTQYINQVRLMNTTAFSSTPQNFRMAIYERTNVTSNTAAAGVSSGNNIRIMRPRSATTSFAVGANAALVTFTIAADSRGYWASSQPGTTTVTLYQAGASLGTQTSSAVGANLNAAAMYICARNSGPDQFRAATEALLEWGGRAFTAGQELADYTAWQAYATTLGANVP